MLDQPCIEIVSSQVRVTSSRLDLEDTLLNVQQRHIDGSSKIENESVHLAGGHVLPYGMAAAVVVQSKFSFELNLHDLANAERRSAFAHAMFGSKERRFEQRTPF